MELYNELALRKALESISEIRGYVITINNIDVFDLTIWVADDLFTEGIDRQLTKTLSEMNGSDTEFIDFDTDNRERFLGRIEYVTDDIVEFNEDFKTELQKKLIKHAYYPHLNSWFSFNKKFFNERKIPLVSFYSYKGGVGRTTALALIALALAKEQYHVAVIDYDIEAPGLHALLNFSNDKNKYGVLDYFRHKMSFNKTFAVEDFQKYYIQNNSDNGKITLFPATGNTEISYRDYVDKVAFVNFDVFARQGSFILESLFLDIESILKPDIILIDSRTGISDIAGILLMTSDLVSMYFSNNAQNFDGIKIIFNQMKAFSEKNYGDILMPPVVFNHAIIPSWPPSVRDSYTRDAANKVKDVLYDIYGERFADPNFMEGEVNVNPILREDFLEQVTVESLREYTEKYFEMSGHKAVFLEIKKIISDFKIQNLQNESGFIAGYNDESKRKRLIKNILREIEEQNLDAKNEDYNNPEEFKKKFYVSTKMINVLNPGKKIILGAKGSGKTSIFKALLKQKERIRRYINKKPTPFIKLDNFDVITGFEIGAFLTNKEASLFEALNGGLQQTGTKHNPVLFWQNIWECLLAVRLAKEGLFKSILVSQFIEHLTKIATDQVIEFVVNPVIMNQLREELRGAPFSSVYWILYDDLDKVFEGNDLLQKDVISGLISFWQEVSSLYKNLVPKIFLRKDIYDRLQFQNKVNINQWVEDIEWSYIDFHKLMLKRLLSTSNTLRHYFNLVKGEEIWWFETDELGIEVNEEKDNKYLQDMITLLFGYKLYNYPKSATLWYWFKNHLQDGKEFLYPRDLINFLNEVVKEYNNKFEMYFCEDEERLFPSGKLFSKEVMKAISSSRYEAIREEYPEYERLFVNFREKLDVTFPIDRGDLVKKISNVLEMKHSDAEEQVNIFTNLGVLRLYETDERLTMTDLYLEGFNKKRRGPGPSTNN